MFHFTADINIETQIGLARELHLIASQIANWDGKKQPALNGHSWGLTVSCDHAWQYRWNPDGRASRICLFCDEVQTTTTCHRFNAATAKEYFHKMEGK